MSSGLQVHETPDSASPEYYNPSSVEKERYVHQTQPHYSNANANPMDDRKEADYSTRKEESGYSRMRPLWLILITAIVTAIIVGAAVGGGLGSSLKDAQDRKGLTQATTTATVTKTITASSALETNAQGLLINYTAPGRSEIDTLDLDCPGIDGTQHTTQSAYAFSISSSVGYGGGDVGSAITYSLNDCIELCGGLNARQGDRFCTIAAFHASFDAGAAIPYTNCYLHDSNAEPVAQADDSYEALGFAASARLI